MNKLENFYLNELGYLYYFLDTVNTNYVRIETNHFLSISMQYISNIANFKNLFQPE